MSTATSAIGCTHTRFGDTGPTPAGATSSAGPPHGLRSTSPGREQLMYGLRDNSTVRGVASTGRS